MVNVSITKRRAPCFIICWGPRVCLSPLQHSAAPPPSGPHCPVLQGRSWSPGSAGWRRAAVSSTARSILRPRQAVCLYRKHRHNITCMLATPLPKHSKLFFSKLLKIFWYDILIKMKVIMFSILPTSLRDWRLTGARACLVTSCCVSSPPPPTPQTSPSSSSPYPPLRTLTATRQINKLFL